MYRRSSGQFDTGRQDYFGSSLQSSRLNEVDRGGKSKGLSNTTKIIILAIVLCGFGIVAYAIFVAVSGRNGGSKESDDILHARAAEETIRLRRERNAELRATYDAKKILDAEERQKVAEIVFGFRGPIPTPVGAASNLDGQVLINDYNANFEAMTAGSNLAASDPTTPPDKVYKIVLQSIALALCPRQMYQLWSNVQNAENMWMCLQNCPAGYESLTYAPRDGSGNPLKVHPIDPITGKEDYTKLEQVPATPWCRAICPLLVASPKTQLPVNSEHLTPDIKPVIYNNNLKRTDDADPAYCTRAKEQRKILTGGNNIVCGWCEKDIDLAGGATGTSVNRHHCDTGRSGHYGIDFTDWCQRRRLIPNFRIDKSDDNLNTGVCSAISGVLGQPKKMEWIEGPRGCRGNADLLPINSAGYFDGNGNAIGLVTTKNLFSGSNIYKIPDDKIVARFAADPKKKDDLKDYSLMHYACYTACPIRMAPVGPVENHLCAESCPPNTSSLLTFSDDIRCKKMAFQQPVAIDDFMLVISEVAKAYILKMQQGMNEAK